MNSRYNERSGHGYRVRRPAVTLIELLVVVSIVVLLSGMLVPMVQPLLRGQRVREAARQVNVYFAGAQARAVELGRPVGVWIERAGHDSNLSANPSAWYTSYRLYLAEQPAPYTGGLLESRIRLRPNASDPTVWEAWYQWDPSKPYLNCCGDLAPAIQQAIAAQDPRRAIALPGDMIRFNGRGPFFVIDQIDQFKITFIVPVNQFDLVIKYFRPPPNGNPADMIAYQPGVPFEIFRRPLKSAGTPLELPRNTGIDLSLSGYGRPFNSPYNLLPAYNPFIFNPSQFAARFREIDPAYDIVIMFRPEGGVGRVYYVANDLNVLSFWEVPHGMISLLLSRDDQVGRDTQKNVNVTNVHVTNVIGPLGEANLKDQDNIWLSISTLTGRLQSSPNGDAFANASTGVPVVNLPLTASDDARVFIQNARRFASTGQSMGGQ